ncbi:unnamed protein product, partial [Hapterophycus canaliculatus]
MDSRGRHLNVVVSREGSLSPRSGSCSASPGRRGRTSFEKQVPQQRKVEVLQKEVSGLHGCLSNRSRGPASWETSYTMIKTREKCKTYQEKMETAKLLLDASRLESAKLSRILAATSRKLDVAQKEAARVPALSAAMDRMLGDKSSAESALGEQGRRNEEERRRSTAWRAQVDKLSLQARNGDARAGEHCRALSNENSELRRDLQRAREMLKKAKVRGAAIDGMADSLRLKSIEVGLLTDELGAVREDCGRLVQLVGSTKEYAQFRRLWDESEGLTFLNNVGTMSPFYAAASRGGGSGRGSGRGGGGGSGRGSGSGSSLSINARTEDVAPFSGEGMHQLLRGSAEACGRMEAVESNATSWEQAMRSEWSSPAEKLLKVVAAAPPPPPPAPPWPSASAEAPRPNPAEATAAKRAAAAAAATEEHKPELKRQISALPGGRPGIPRARGGRLAGDVVPKMARKVSFSQRSDSPCRRPRKDRQLEEKSASRTARGCAVPGAFLGASAGVNAETSGYDSGGSGGRSGAAEVVRWGRVDLLSVVYPPLPAPPAREGPGTEGGSDGQRDFGSEFSMWVPREAAALCRRFVRDFDGYSGLPMDAEQHRLLWRLVLGLNAKWRQSERKHVERLRTRYRSELAAAHRRLDMRKPMEVVVAERAAERRRPCSASGYPSGPAAGVPSHGKTRRPREWGKDGRRVRPAGSSGPGDDSVGATCGRSCGSGAGTEKESSAGRGKMLRAKGHGGKRVTV